ncbi:10478_t:CDS:2 [Gigaspora margarita]|uniref:10478_t:CDS:1 n=1 Tax=Gigaspora margarita TaxID=4874 RepID=A0ABM8VWN1_GIGMA|nr:10478_t:CDS:2 [Gigaspora margarita]
MVNAQNYIDTNCPKNTTTKIIQETPAVNTEIEIDPAATKLEGDLILKDYPNLEEFDVSEHALTSLTVINCPKLRVIDASNNYEGNDTTKKTFKKIELEKIGAGNKLEELSCGDSKITEISFANLSELQELNCPNTPTLDRFKHLNQASKIRRINVTGSAPIVFMHEVRYNYLEDTVKEIKSILGLKPEENLPTVEYKDSSGRTQRKIDTASLGTQIKSEINDQVPQLETAKENAEKERDETRANYDTIKAERDQLQQQLTAIRNELGLTESSTKEQVIDKIKELMKKPTSSHTDYDAIKAERDSLKTENAKLKNDKKENESKEKIQSAVSAENVEEIRNEIIKDEFNKLNSENKGSFYLNIGLGVLTMESKISIKSLISTRNFLAEIVQNARNDYERAGEIQAFEVCYELAKNTIRKVLLLRAQEVPATPKEVFRLAGLEEVATEILKERHQKIVQQILAKYPYQFYAYGSRVKGTARQLSDLDICYQENIPDAVAFQIEEEFKESDLPFMVELQISNYQPTKNKNPKKQPVNNPPSPSPIPNNNFSSKTLANTIKEDLQDALTNESRQTKYFLDYQVFDNGDITIRTEENEKLNEELQENFHRHYQQRREK